MPILKPVPKDEQIRALLQWDGVNALAERYFRRPHLSGAECGQIFTVTRAEVLAHVQAHGLPPGAYRDEPSVRDGVYMHEEDGVYVVYYQERGDRWPASTHRTRNEAADEVVRQLLAIHGAYLRHEA